MALLDNEIANISKRKYIQQITSPPYFNIERCTVYTMLYAVLHLCYTRLLLQAHTTVRSTATKHWLALC